MTFRVGMKVVCVDAVGARPLINGGIYTVSKVGLLDSGAVGINVVEDTTPCGWPIHWRASRFRPVVERKTDISIFTAMLNPSQVTVCAG